ncbi:uncharacterized protein LOC131891285 [Tigriopus californicus]|uniref:uncharacterized protein LOC131891285 n=1 Tax=Tigriopus californicus TaxID=6832 RepID=UPI0027DA7546|nr:uncharacterized protein LOC131891285 [Tigriopus californicus]
MRRHVIELNVAKSTIEKAVHKDLGLSSNARVPRHLLTESLKAKRLERSSKDMNWLKHNPSTVNIFSDKKLFPVDQVYNRRNDRFLASSTSEVKGVFRTKHPAAIMVLGVVASDGKKMPPYFFKVGEKFGVLRYHILPWLKISYPDGNYVWTQDGAPCHTAKINQKF